MTKSSYRQTEYLRTLALSAGFPSGEDAVITAGFTCPADTAETSATIDRLKSGDLIPKRARRTKPKAEDGGITPEQAFSLLGKRVQVTGRGILRDGTIKDDADVHVMDVEAIRLSPLTGLPVITGTRCDRPVSLSRHLHLIESYSVLS